MNIFKKIYNYRELLKTNVKKEIRGRYKNSILGVIWSFLNPLLQLVVYSIVFGALFNGGENYYIYICVALIPWTYFTTTITQSAFTIIGNADIIKKVYFPREILPISIVTSGLVNFLISCIIIFIFLIFTGIGFSKYIIFFPLYVLIEYILILGFVFILSSVTVYLRDLEHIIGVIIQALFYATPIVYSMNMIPKAFAWVFQINPMAYVIQGFRDTLYYQTMPDLHGLFVISIFSLILLVIGYKIFDKLQKNFAEEL